MLFWRTAIVVLIFALASGARAEVTPEGPPDTGPSDPAQNDADVEIDVDTPVTNDGRRRRPAHNSKGSKTSGVQTKDSRLERPDGSKGKRTTPEISLGDAVAACETADTPGAIVDTCSGVIDHSSATQDAQAMAYRRRGMAQFELGNYIDAVLDLDFALEFGTVDPALLDLRGRSHAKLGHYRDAMSDLDAAIRADAENPVFLRNRAVLHREMAQHSEALDDLERALALDNGYGEALVERAMVRCDLRLVISAMDDWSIVLEAGAYRVHDLQFELANNGYYDGDIDGVFDAETRRSLRAWIIQGCA